MKNIDLTPKTPAQALGMLVTAPLMGAALVVFLPCIGFVLLGEACYIKLTTYFKSLSYKKIQAVRSTY